MLGSLRPIWAVPLLKVRRFLYNVKSDIKQISISGKVLQICPHFKQLDAIYGDKNGKSDFVIVDSGDFTTVDACLIENDEPMLESSFSLTELTDSVPNMDSSLPPPITGSDVQVSSENELNVSKKGKEFAEKLRRNAPNSSAAQLAAFQASRKEIFLAKLEWEKEKHKKDLEMAEKK